MITDKQETGIVLLCCVVLVCVCVCVNMQQQQLLCCVGVCVCVCVYTQQQHHRYGSQRATCGTHFFSSTMWFLEIRLRSLDLVAETNEASLQPRIFKSMQGSLYGILTINT